MVKMFLGISESIFETIYKCEQAFSFLYLEVSIFCVTDTFKSVHKKC